MRAGRVQLPYTHMDWDEDKNRIEITVTSLPSGPVVMLRTTYDGGRELLDCLMLLFGRHELTTRYPEVR